MPKLLAGRHYNEEEISRHLGKNIRYWPVQMNGNKFATGQILNKPVEVVKGADLSWLSSKVSANPAKLKPVAGECGHPASRGCNCITQFDISSE